MAQTSEYVTRRGFVKWTAFLAQGGNSLLRHAQAAQAEVGKWVPVACWNHCGGRCPLYAYVVDGVVARLKGDDSHADSPDHPQQRGCARGRAQRFQVFGADRLKYPMKRSNWRPGGGDRQLRGRDDWVRISWDEALDLIAGEIRRIKESYGNTSILYPSSGAMRRVFYLYGGCVEPWGEVSWGTWPEVYRHVTGMPCSASAAGNDRMRLRQAKLIVLWGANPAWSSGGVPSYHYLQAKRAGARFIVVDSHYSDSAQALAEQWIPVRPGTDSALLLGMAYHIVANQLHDQAFLDHYCVGFDRHHMPAGADPKDNFKDYLLGGHDGQPKTPEWASRICGTAPELIRRFAEVYARTKPALIQAGCAPARIHRGEQFPHALLTLAFLTGNIGIPGSGVGPSFYYWAGNAGPPLIRLGSTGVTAVGANPLDCRINNCELWDAVLSGVYTHRGQNKSIDIRLIYHENQSALNQKVGAMKAIAAHRHVEFVVSQNYVFDPNCQFSDIVLPVTTPWEQSGTVATGNREILLWSSQVTPPLFEARDDIWIAREVGRRLGIDPGSIDPLPLKQQIFNALKGARVIRQDGKTWEPLIAITAADIAELGVQGEPQAGRIPLKQLRAKGIYQVPRTPGDKLGYTTLEEFRKDPAGQRLATPSGKLEIYSRPLAEAIRAVGYNDKDPLPKYEPVPEGYEETFSDWDSKVKGEYPLQLITIHYPRRAHTAFDNVPQLRAAFPQELMMNPLDAAQRGIRNGDIVLVRSRHGKVIRPALLTQRITPGVVILGQGAWIDLDETSGIDRAGSTNILNGAIPSGQGHSGFNTCIVEVEKYGQPLPPDFTWPLKTALAEVPGV